MKRTKFDLRHVAGIAATLCIASVVIAAPADEPDPDKQDSQCAAAVKDWAAAAGKEASKEVSKAGPDLSAKFRQMRNGCSKLRSCKRSCRQSKRNAVKACRSLKGKAKRKCKQAARQNKRSCKSSCRTAESTKSCKDGRRAFWSTLGSAVGRAAKSATKAKGNSVKNACQSLYTK